MVQATLAETRIFHTTGKMPDSLRKRREEAKKQAEAEQRAADKADQSEEPESATEQRAAEEKPRQEIIHPVPTMDNTKAEIVAYMEDEGIEHDARNTKQQLLDLIE